MKALVIQTAFLGDAVISLALAEELRRLSPDSNISYLVRPEAASIIELSPSVDKVYTFDKYHSEKGIGGIRKKASELNNAAFDVVFSLHNSKRTRMLLARLNAPQKIGYGEGNELTHRIKDIAEPRTSRAIRLVQAIFPIANLNTLPKLTPLESALPEEVKLLTRPIIVVTPDSVWRTKQWGFDKFSELIYSLQSKKYSIILTGTNKSYGLLNNFNSMKNNVLDLTSKTSLETLVSIISYSDLLIANDSAPVHIATATRTPCLVIYGPTVPEFGFTPPQDLGIIIQNENLWCRPCASHGSNECPIHTHECMRGISIERVFEASIESLHKHH